MLFILDIALNASRINEHPKGLKYLIEGDKNLSTIKKNIKPIITMNDTKVMKVKTNKK
jgi:hypothetical protein